MRRCKRRVASWRFISFVHDDIGPVDLPFAGCHLVWHELVAVEARAALERARDPGGDPTEGDHPSGPGMRAVAGRPHRIGVPVISPEFDAVHHSATGHRPMSTIPWM